MDIVSIVSMIDIDIYTTPFIVTRSTLLTRKVLFISMLMKKMKSHDDRDGMDWVRMIEMID